MNNLKEKHENINIILGDPKKAIKKLAVPMIISMFLIMAYNLADSIWIAGLGPDALAAIGFISPIFMIIIGLGNGIGAGANSLIARSIGGKNKKVAENAAIHSIIITIIISIILPIIVLPFLKDILLIMGGGNSVKLGLEYGNIVFALMFVFLFSSVTGSILRSEGDVKRAMYVMVITAILNIIIDPIFIYSFNMGIAGAAWATVISGFISSIIIGYWIWIKKDTYLSLNKKAYTYKKWILKDILKVAIPATSENLIISILVISINTILVIVAGTTAVAVYTAGMRIIQMAMIPIIGLGTAVLTVTGASYGAHNYKKLSTGFHYSIKLGFIISGIIGLLIFIFAGQISQIFAYTSVSANLAPKITIALRIICLFTLSVPFGLISSMVFQGVGKGIVSLILTVFRSLVFELIFAYVFGITLGFGELGIYFGVVIGGGLGALFAYIWARLFIRSLKRDTENKYIN